jgi:hypothetical protein
MSDLTKNHLGRHMGADQIIRQLSAILGWSSATPWHVLERDLAEKLTRLRELTKPKPDVYEAALARKGIQPVDNPMTRALVVILTDPKISAWLRENDPNALVQATRAVCNDPEGYQAILASVDFDKD